MNLRDIATALSATVIGDGSLEIVRIVHPADAEGAGDLAVALTKEALGHARRHARRGGADSGEGDRTRRPARRFLWRQRAHGGGDPDCAFRSRPGSRRGHPCRCRCRPGCRRGRWRQHRALRGRRAGNQHRRRHGDPRQRDGRRGGHHRPGLRASSRRQGRRPRQDRRPGDRRRQHRHRRGRLQFHPGQQSGRDPQRHRPPRNAPIRSAPW